LTGIYQQWVDFTCLDNWFKIINFPESVQYFELWQELCDVEEGGRIILEISLIDEKV